MHSYTLTESDGQTCSASVSFRFSPPWNDPQFKGFDIIILAGQSNMVGDGFGPFIDRLRDSYYDGLIFQIGRFGASNLRVVPVGYVQNGIMTDGLQFWGKTEGQSGLSLGLSLAQEYARTLAPGRKLLLIPAARDGSNLQCWLNKAYSVDSGCPSEPTLYADMMTRIGTALSFPGDNRIVSFHWQQGEHNIKEWLAVRLGRLKGHQVLDPATYRSTLDLLIAQLRSDLDLPSLPFIAGNTVPTWVVDPAFPVESEVIKVEFERAIAKAVIDSVPSAHVDTSGLVGNDVIGARGGAVHFDAESEYKLGVRHWNALSEVAH
jgi:hypothetical protein